jgi:hypothetical protein
VTLATSVVAAGASFVMFSARFAAIKLLVLLRRLAYVDDADAIGASALNHLNGDHWQLLSDTLESWCIGHGLARLNSIKFPIEFMLASHSD